MASSNIEQIANAAENNAATIAVGKAINQNDAAKMKFALGDVKNALDTPKPKQSERKTMKEELPSNMKANIAGRIQASEQASLQWVDYMWARAEKGALTDQQVNQWIDALQNNVYDVIAPPPINVIFEQELPAEPLDPEFDDVPPPLPEYDPMFDEEPCMIEPQRMSNSVYDDSQVSELNLSSISLHEYSDDDTFDY